MDSSIALATCAEIFQHCPTLHARGEETHEREENGRDWWELNKAEPIRVSSTPQTPRTAEPSGTSENHPLVTTEQVLRNTQGNSAPLTATESISDPAEMCQASSLCELTHLLAAHHCNPSLLLLDFKTCRLWPSSLGDAYKFQTILLFSPLPDLWLHVADSYV